MLVPPSAWAGCNLTAGGGVREHDDGVSDLKLRMGDVAARGGHAHALGGAERPLVELDGLRRVVDGKKRGEGVVALGNRLCRHGSPF